MNLTDQKVSGINEINLQDSLNAAVLGLKIKVGIDTIEPEGNDLIIYVDKESSSSPTTYRKQYTFNLNSTLKSVGEVSDELIQLVDIKNNESRLKTYVKRNIATNDSGNYITSQAIIEDLENIDITLFEGINYIYTNYSNAQITIVYPKDDDLNRMFINSSIYNRNKKLNNEISLDDIYFKDSFTKIGNELNEEIDNLNVKCITSKNNKFSLDSEGNLVVNSITTNQGNSEINNSDICNLIYPIGSIYLSVNSVNPNTLFGGTWTQLKDRFLLGTGNTYTNGSTGGEAKVTINRENLPAMSLYRSSATQGYGNNNWTGPINGWGNFQNNSIGTSGVAMNNMPPYLVVYMWKRIS